jgi:DNA-binding NarL/FixJ family response regulator
MHADANLIKDAADAGAMGYLVKDCSTDDIVAAIAAAKEGNRTFPDPGAAAASNRAAASPTENGRPVITAREAEVLQMIADGHSTTEAARALYVSVKTVKNHLASAYAKLDAHDRTQAVLRAARLGLVDLDRKIES